MQVRVRVRVQVQEYLPGCAGNSESQLPSRSGHIMSDRSLSRGRIRGWRRRPRWRMRKGEWRSRSMRSRRGRKGRRRRSRSSPSYLYSLEELCSEDDKVDPIDLADRRRNDSQETRGEIVRRPGAGKVRCQEVR